MAAVKKENTFTLKTENKNRNTATAVVVLAVAAVLLAIDQMLKYFVLRDLRPVGTVTVIPGLLELTYVENTGAAFGLFKQVMCCSAMTERLTGSRTRAALPYALLPSCRQPRSLSTR